MPPICKAINMPAVTMGWTLFLECIVKCLVTDPLENMNHLNATDLRRRSRD
jgi:hypothetical protein